MQVQKINYYQTHSFNNKVCRNMTPTFGRNNTYSGYHSTVYDNDNIYGSAHIGNLVVKNEHSFFGGDSPGSISLDDSLDVDRITSEGSYITKLSLDGKHKIGTIEPLILKLIIRGGTTVDSIKNVEYLGTGPWRGPIKINNIYKANNVDIDSDGELGVVNTNFFETGNPHNLHIKELNTSVLSLWGGNTGDVKIDKLSLDTAKRNELKNNGFIYDLYITGNVKVDDIVFKNGFGELEINDRSDALPPIKKSNIHNGRLVCKIEKLSEIKEEICADEIIIGDTSYNKVKKANKLSADKILMKSVVNVDSIKSKQLEMLNSSCANNIDTQSIKMKDNSSARNIKVENKAELSGNASVQDLTLVNHNAEVHISDNASVKGQIVFANGNGKVYVNSTSTSINNSQVVGGKIIKRIYSNTSSDTLNGLDKVAGMEELKEILREDVIEPMKHPDKYRRYGIDVINGFLMYGPPGCGKTFIAKMLAEETNRSFFEISSSSIGSIYQYEPQINIKRVFDSARSNAPSIIFIDEAESLLSKRENLAGDNPDSNATITELLQQINNCRGEKVLVILASNEPQKIDNAVKRTGRMDKKIYVGEPDLQTRIGLFAQNLNDIYSDKDIDIEKLANMTNYYTADDIRLIVRQAAQKAVKRDEPIKEQDLIEAIHKQPPSLSKDMVDYYKSKADFI